MFGREGSPVSLHYSLAMDLLDSDLHADVKGGAQSCELVWTSKLCRIFHGLLWSLVLYTPNGAPNSAHGISPAADGQQKP